MLVAALRLLLASVFVLAGAGKLADRPGTRRALADFGTPPPLVPGAAVLLPAAELLVAWLLLAEPLAPAGAAGALVLLLIFTGTIAVSLSRGRTPDCHCFGQLHSSRAGWRTLARNAALAAIAAIVAVMTRRGLDLQALSLDAAMWPTLLVGGGAGAATIWLRARQARGAASSGLAEGWLIPNAVPEEATEAIAGSPAITSDATLAVGSTAPHFSLPDLDGRVVTLNHLLERGLPVLLIFSDPACGPCAALLPDIATWDREHASTLTIALVSRGSADLNRTKLGSVRLSHVLLQADREVAAAYGSQGTPAAVLIRADGTLGSPLAPGTRAVLSLIEHAIGASGAVPDKSAGLAPVQPLARGTPAPVFTLPDVDGRPVTFPTTTTGRPTLLIFWNPDCGFCQRMLRHVQGCERLPRTSRPDITIVSAGTVDAVRAQQLTSPTLIDSDFAVGRAYGIRGTPSAVLVGADGRIAGDVAVGEAPILAVAGYRPGAALSGDLRLRKTDDVHDELLEDGSMVVYAAASRKAHTLNGTAALIWESCDGERSIDEIVAEVEGLFPAAATASADVRALLDTLVADGMLTAAPGGAVAGDRTPLSVA